MDSDTNPTPDIDGSLRDSPVTVIAIVVILSLALVGTAYALFAPDATLDINETDTETTITASEVEGYDELVVKYDAEEVSLAEGESVTIPNDTAFKVVGVLGENETILHTSA